MVQQTSWRSPVFNAFHTPADIERESFADGIKTEISFPVQTPFLFSSLVFSVNYEAQQDGYILLEAQVFVQGKWSDFFQLGLFAATTKKSFPVQQTSFGAVSIDELLVSHPAAAYRYRLKFFGKIKLSLLTASTVRASFKYEAHAAVHLPENCFEKSVMPISQMALKHPDRRRVCSPVSLCMALNALGVAVTPEEVMRGVYDASAGIYGNWIFNTAYAGSFGLQAYVRRFGALNELKDYVTSDSLVIASVAYGKGELSGAAIEHTDGHLVLIRGWEKGKVRVADPAASTRETVLRAYDAREFAEAWLNHKQGAAYIVRKK